LAIPALFQLHAELQLCKRFLAESHRSRTATPPVDMRIIQHRISTICLQLNRFSFDQVFSEIVALGSHTDTFLVSFVNVVFRQAANECFHSPSTLTLITAKDERVIPGAVRMYFRRKNDMLKC
jgi:hypothetical protein